MLERIVCFLDNEYSKLKKIKRNREFNSLIRSLMNLLFNDNSNFDSLLCSLIEKEKDEFRKLIGRYNEKLSYHAGFMEKLRRNRKKLEREEEELAEKIKENIKQGNTGVVQQLEEVLSAQKRQIEILKKHYNVAENRFQKLARSRDLAVCNAQQKIRNIENIINEIRMCEAQYELQQGHINEDDFDNAVRSELSVIELLAKFKLISVKEKLKNVEDSPDFYTDELEEAFKELEKQTLDKSDGVDKQEE